MTYISTPDLQIALGRYADTVQIKLYDTVDSTNTAAKSEALESVSPALYIARTQTGGRGRLGRSFHSPADTGLYMTVAYTTDKPLAEAVRVTAGASVAAVRAIEAATDKRPAIKWVNDLYLGGGKVGGILTEGVPLPRGGTRVVVGLGINLTTRDFPEGLRAPATSLFSPAEGEAMGRDLPARLAGLIARRLLELVEDAPASPLPGGLRGEACRSFYRRHLLWVGEAVTCTRGSETLTGIIRGVDADYSLLLETEGGILPLSSGEITVRPTEG